jgi:glycosyltransferase involved in cell wall biosynthesis
VYSIVIPIYNEAESISKTLSMIDSACQFAGLDNIEVVIVDDGSTDATGRIVRDHISSCIDIKLLRQDNLGRFSARFTGALYASNSNLIFIDSRVWIHKASLEYLIGYRAGNPNSKVIIGTVVLPPDVNLVGRFWRSLEKIFWRKFYTSGLNVSLTLDDFHKYPKGTTLVYFEREIFLEICKDVQAETYVDQNSNDDTLLFYNYLKWGGQVEILRQFTATYFPRTKLRSFLQHARHRGSVAGDGFLQLRTWQGVLFRLTYLAVFPIGYLLFTHPAFLMPLLILLLIACVLLMFLPLSLKDFLSLSLFLFPFYISYSMGFFSSFIRRIRKVPGGR